jgi:Recombinational DNA repair ATPase (RecF pathway)
VFLKQVWLEQYRNIQKACIQPARHLTVLYGRNGQGKTNFLESLYLLGNARPFRAAKVPDLISHGSRSAAVRGLVLAAALKVRLYSM